MCKAVQTLLASIELTLRSNTEFLCVSIDATLTVAMSVKCQASYRSNAAVRNQACIGNDEALRSTLSYKGSDGHAIN